MNLVQGVAGYGTRFDKVKVGLSWVMVGQTWLQKSNQPITPTQSNEAFNALDLFGQIGGIVGLSWVVVGLWVKGVKQWS